MSLGHDSASIMSRHCAGVQQKLYKHAAYVHCHVHCLNLVYVDGTKSVLQASGFITYKPFFNTHE